jgi:hypothetical protein
MAVAAIRYVLSHWRVPHAYVDDGLLEIDNSAAEGRFVPSRRDENTFFCGSNFEVHLFLSGHLEKRLRGSRRSVCGDEIIRQDIFAV